MILLSQLIWPSSTSSAQISKNKEEEIIFQLLSAAVQPTHFLVSQPFLSSSTKYRVANLCFALWLHQ
ncbi:hypothetical protein BLOT_015469 [Blomia tropicalis]|nr:hypothetical protein BLOT_015469 [Blomia tropicalis]